MVWSHIANYISVEWQHTTILEIVAVFFAVCEVLLAYKNKVLLYPAGIISTAIYIWIYLHVKLYADAGLNVYYLAMSTYGWLLWTVHKNKKNQKAVLPITRATRRERWIAFGIFLVGFGLIHFVLVHWTDSTTPLGDAFMSSVAWAGMWLLAKRKLENWMVLNISNAASIPLLIYKELPLTALLTLFLFIVAIFGYFKWKNIMIAGADKATAS